MHHVLELLAHTAARWPGAPSYCDEGHAYTWAETRAAVVGQPPPPLLARQVEAVLAVVRTAPAVRALHEAGVVLARVWGPVHGRVGRD